MLLTTVAREATGTTPGRGLVGNVSQGLATPQGLRTAKTHRRPESSGTAQSLCGPLFADALDANVHVRGLHPNLDIRPHLRPALDIGLDVRPNLDIRRTRRANLDIRPHVRPDLGTGLIARPNPDIRPLSHPNLDIRPLSHPNLDIRPHLRPDLATRLIAGPNLDIRLAGRLNPGNWLITRSPVGDRLTGFRGGRAVGAQGRPLV
ncbi:hypothetical protein [Sphaerisporangium album]|uniref:hypothetical protein n=1 Tax=Sphaerisporangium album TaxID=509200 RepID=UPI001FE697F1|nr:hypothetical protein [Sphaerisporangium album]